MTDNSVTSTNGDIDADGRFTWTPDDTHGDTTITFTFTLTDSAGGEALPETVSFDVTESKDPPSDITYTTSDALAAWHNAKLCSPEPYHMVRPLMQFRHKISHLVQMTESCYSYIIPF